MGGGSRVLIEKVTFGVYYAFSTAQGRGVVTSVARVSLKPSFSLNLDKGAWHRKILKPEFHCHNSEVVHNAAQKETTITSFSCFSCRFVYNGVGVAYIRCTCFRSTLWIRWTFVQFFSWQNCPDVFILPSSQRCPLERIQSLTWTIQGRQQNKNWKIDYKIIIIDYVIHQIYFKSYIIYHILCIKYFHQIRKWKLRSQIFFMVGVWLSGVFIFAGDNKYDSVKSNYQLKELFFYIDYDCLY